MIVTARAVEVRGSVPPTSLAIVPGEVRVIETSTDERPKMLSLALGGRVRPDGGEVAVDGRPAPDELRRCVALVDTPFASEPSPTVSLATEAAEDLAFAGLPSGRRAVAAALEGCGLGDAARTPVERLETGDRLALLCGLAARRPDVEALVVTSPERHGGDPADWFPRIASLAAREESPLGVLVVTDATTARALIQLGAIPASDPVPDSEPDPEPTPDPESDPTPEDPR